MLAENIRNLAESFWNYFIEERPEFAIYRGVSRHPKAILDSYDLSVYARRKEFCESFRARLDEVTAVNSERALLSRQDAATLAMLRHCVDTCLNGIDFKCHLMHYNYWEGVDVYFPKYTAERLTMTTVEDYRFYLELLRAFPKQVQETIGLLKEGVRQRIVSNKVSIVSEVISRLKQSFSGTIDDSPFYRPFNRMPETINDHDREELQMEGRQCIVDHINRSLSELHSYIINEYVPHLRVEPSINRMSGGDGRDLYKAFLQYYSSLSVNPVDIHNKALEEMSNTHERLRLVRLKLGFDCSMQEYRRHVDSQETLHFTCKEDVLKACEETVYTIIRPVLEKAFIIDQPDIFSLRLNPHNRDVAKAVYNGPTLDGSTSGVIWVSAGQPKRFLRSEVMTLMLHEAVPGHHLQCCMAMHNDNLPLFRKTKDDRRYMEAPGGFPMNDAYTEGWGLYCEELGYELGLYDDPRTEYSYLCADLGRTIRIIVDTGLHALEWSREKAQEFMAANGFLSRAIDIEIDRYITWPGQACSYKIGYWKFKELRSLAEKSLGEQFDIRKFHKACLDCGTVSLPILEDIINDYIHETKISAAST